MKPKTNLDRVPAMLTEAFGVDRATAICAMLFISVVTVLAVFWFIHSAPPTTITITSGPVGSNFETNAVKYARILARSDVKLKILPSQGSVENLKRLSDPSFQVDIGFVQGGTTNVVNTDKLVSLGSIAYQPLLIFYRGAVPVDLISKFSGKRLAIGPEGSGTRSLALTLLAANGMGIGGTTTLVDLEAENAAKALLEGGVDAVFLMGESASRAIMRTLLRTEGIYLFDFAQADAYTRRISYLNKLTLPRGSIDFGKDIPARDMHLLGPTVEIIARPTLHPALSDLLIEAAREVHEPPSLFQRRGEFPAPLGHDVRVSDDAARFYKSGKSFLYRYLPFAIAGVVNRILVVFLPMIVVLIPGLRLIPSIYQWRMKLRINRWYGALLAVERSLVAQVAPEKREELLARLNEIEKAVNKMKVPASFADQFYWLRENIGFVRNQLTDNAQPSRDGEERAEAFRD